MTDLKAQFPKIYEEFKGDEFAASTFINKYVLRDVDGNYLEHSVSETIERVMGVLGGAMPTETPSKEWLEKNSIVTGNPPTWKELFIEACALFQGVCPQGSILSAAGNTEFPQSFSNCFVIDGPEDSIADIFRAGEQEAQLMKKRGGVGLDISKIRPFGYIVKNAARTSSGAVGWMDYFSNVCRTIGQCLHPDTLVLTENGLERISNLEIGSKVWTQNGWTKVLNKIENKKDTYKVTTKYGREVIASAEHVFHSDGKEIKLKDFKIGDKITAIYGQGWSGKYQILKEEVYKKSSYNGSNRLNTDVTLPKVLDENLAYFLGQTYGDGHVIVKGKIPCGVEIASSDSHSQVKDKVINTIVNVFNFAPKVNKGCGSCETIVLNSRVVVEYLKYNNLLKQKTKDIVFPEILLKSPTSVVMSFISGFFDADGCTQLSKKTYKIASINKQFILSIQSVLLAHGVISKVFREDRSHLKWNDLYTLSVNGNKSQGIFKSLMKESVKVQNSKDWIPKVRDFNRTVFNILDLGSNSSRHSYIIDNEQKITYSTLERLAKDLDIDIHKFNLLEDEVVSVVKYKKQQKVFDISLPHTHFFSANGLYVHNSGRRGALMITLDIKHPDAELFAKAKLDLKYCTGANISLKISDEFMNAVKNDTDFTQQWPIDSANPKVIKTIKARDLWKVINNCAWSMAEPGLIFWDNAINNLPAHCYPEFKSTSTNPCQPGWAPILTHLGVRQLKDIKIGDKIWSSEGWTKVVNKWSTGIKDVFRYRTSTGVFDGTENHKLLSNGQKVEARLCESIDFLRGDYLDNIVEHIPQHVMDGLMLGDGTWHKASNRGFLCIGVKDQDYHTSEIAHLIIKKSKSDRFNWDIKSTISQEELTKTFNRTVPDRFIYGTRQEVCSFLRGLYSANGSVVAGRVTLKASSSKIIEQVQVLLSSLGICSYFTTNKSKDVLFKNGTYTSKESYDLNISRDKAKFVKLIGFLQDYKNIKIQSHTESIKIAKKEKVSYDIRSVEYISTEEVFDLTVDNSSHTYWTGGVNVSNCSEIILSNFDACRLATICLTKYVKNPFDVNCFFDFKEFEKDVRIGMRLMDGTVTAEIKAIDAIIHKINSETKVNDLENDLWVKVRQAAKDGRRTGLGTHGLGDAILKMNLAYDSDGGLKLIEKIYHTLMVSAYDESVEMAKEYGSFPLFNWELEKNCLFIKRLPQDLQDKIAKFGRRNVSILTCAPTGTLSILSRCSSGIEPIFRLMYLRRRKVNPTDIDSRVDFVDEVGDKWQNHQIFHGALREYLDKFNIVIPPSVREDSELMQYIPDFFVTSDKIDWKRRIEIQGVAQSKLDHSISSTVNLPADVTQETVEALYELSWEKGLKGITVYRDGCRSGVLISNTKEDPKQDRPQSIERNHSPIRPEALPCEVHITKVKGEEYVVIVGLMNGSVYEMFFGKHNNHIPTKQFSGIVSKSAKGKYLLMYTDAGNKPAEIDINKYFNNENYACVTRLLSMSLRHGTPLELIIEQLHKTSSSITGFESAICRILKKYIKLEDLQKRYKQTHGDNVQVKVEDGCITVVNLDTGVVESKCD